VAIEHKNIANDNLHEPKDVSTASANNVYLADGAGSGNWRHPSPHGGWYYSNIGTGTTYSTPTSYTLMSLVSTATGVHEFTHNSLGRLTYTGTPDRHLHIVLDTSFKHSTGSGQDIYMSWYKNGVEETGSNIVRTADSANYGQVAMHWDDIASTNDYYEVYLKTASGNVIIHKAYGFIMGMPD